MKKLLILTSMLAFLGSLTFAQTTWKIDGGHSSVGFSVVHMGISKTTGKFGEYTIQYDATNHEDFSDAQISAVIQTASIDTDNEKRDGHLRTADFFDVEKYPEITFKSTGIKKKTGNQYLVKGDMTMHGKTLPVSFDAELTGTGDDPWGNTRSGWTATTTINRSDFGMDGSSGMVGDEVTITLNMEFIQKK